MLTKIMSLLRGRKSTLLPLIVITTAVLYLYSKSEATCQSHQGTRHLLLNQTLLDSSDSAYSAPTDKILEEFEEYLAREPNAVSADCSAHSGKDFWKKLKKRHVQVCEASGGDAASSTVTCFTQVNNHFGFCHSSNTILINTGNTSSKPIMVYKDCEQQKKIPHGGIKNEFLEDGSSFNLRHVDEINKDKSVAKSLEEGCKNFIEHPVFFYQRYDTTNMYHSNEDFSTAFVSLNLASLDPTLKKAIKMAGGIEVVIADSHDKGFYLRFWERIGNKAFPLRFLNQQPFPEGTCFKHALYSARGAISLISGAPLGQPVDCSSYVLQAYSNWVRPLLADHVVPGEHRYKWHVLDEVETLQNNIGKQKIHQILYTSRTRFERTHMLGHWQASRHLENEDEMIREIQKLVLERNRKACLPGGHESKSCTGPSDLFEFQALEFSDITYREQLDHTLMADIYFGVHGAALAHSLYLKPQSSVIEILPPAQSGNYHFQHIGRWLDLDYTMIQSGSGGQAPIATIASAIAKAMDRLSGIKA